MDRLKYRLIVRLMRAVKWLARAPYRGPRELKGLVADAMGDAGFYA
jgi:hypothetical protein